MQVAPLAYVPYVTPELNLTCDVGLNTTATSDQDIEVVTSIRMTYNGLGIASVSERFQAAVIGHHINLDVSGYVPGHCINATGRQTGQNGQGTGQTAQLTGQTAAWLALRWRYPALAVAGDFSCEVAGYNHFGKTIVLHSRTAVSKTASAVSTADLYSRLDSLTREVEALRLNQCITTQSTPQAPKPGQH